MDLDPTQAETLACIVDRIFPPDEAPGARDVGADAFVVERVTRDARQSAQVRTVLGRLDRWARDAWGVPFREIDPARQDRGIEQALDGCLDDDGSSSEVLSQLMDLTVQGVFGDPIYGGNRDEAGWKILGSIARPHVRPTQVPPPLRST